MLNTAHSARSRLFTIMLVLALMLLTGACQPANTNSNANVNTNTPPANSNAGLANANTNSADRGTVINAREPEKYSATLQFNIETEGGDKVVGVPSLSLQVAPEKVRQQIDALTNAVAAILKAMMSGQGSQSDASPSPTASNQP